MNPPTKSRLIYESALAPDAVISGVYTGNTKGSKSKSSKSGTQNCSEECSVYVKMFDCCGPLPASEGLPSPHPICIMTRNLGYFLCPGYSEDNGMCVSAEDFCWKFSPPNSDSTGCPCFPGCYLGCIEYVTECCGYLE